MSSRYKWTFLLAASAACALFFLAYPIYVIRPFRHQGATELQIALAVLRFRPAVMLVACALAALCAVQYWRLSKLRLRRYFVIAAALAVFVFAALSRVNIYELMFHPAGQPEFTAASAAKLDGAEHVLAVRIAGGARAYPIRSISYHHIVNDRLGGVPIVATY